MHACRHTHDPHTWPGSTVESPGVPLFRAVLIETAGTIQAQDTSLSTSPPCPLLRLPIRVEKSRTEALVSSVTCLVLVLSKVGYDGIYRALAPAGTGAEQLRSAGSTTSADPSPVLSLTAALQVSVEKVTHLLL